MNETKIEFVHNEPFMAVGCQLCIIQALKPYISETVKFELSRYELSGKDCRKCGQQNQPELSAFYLVKLSGQP